MEPTRPPEHWVASYPVVGLAYGKCADEHPESGVAECILGFLHNSHTRAQTWGTLPERPLIT